MKKQRKYLTEEELKRFLKGIESTRDRAIFTVSYWRGLRAAEPGQLKLSDWDRKAQRLFVHRGKGSVSGQALLSPAQSRTLEAWIRVRGVDCSRHLLNNQKSRPDAASVSRPVRCAVCARPDKSSGCARRAILRGSRSCAGRRARARCK